MRRVYFLGLLALVAAGEAAANDGQRLLTVTLDPGAPSVRVEDRLPVTPATGFDLLLLPAFTLEASGDDDAVRRVETVGPEPGRDLTRWRVALQAGDTNVTLRYGGALARLEPEGDPRRVLGRRAPAAAPEGSYLPAESGWYALTPFAPAGYTLTLHLPAGQRGVVPGDLVEEVADGGGTVARFAFPVSEDGIDLVAGPYGVRESHAGTVRIRTYFGADVADLAQDYLALSARYVERFAALIGPYPFTGFSVVASPLPTGLAMPGFTYVGARVLRLPFIRTTSLPHEVLHNWWGNGVRVDWQRGNWSEGLTTYLADYALRAEEGPAAARELRLAWLRDQNALAPGSVEPLRRFTARRHGASQIVGYQRAAYLFLMLEERIGTPAFTAAIRALWRDHRFREAAWADLEQAFATAAGTSLGRFFAEWLDRTEVPELSLADVRVEGTRLRLTVAQGTPPFALRVPVRVQTETGEDSLSLALDGTTATLDRTFAARVRAVAVDPDYRLLRRLAPAELPPILREAMVNPATRVLVLAAGDDYRRAALALAERVLDAPPAVAATDASGPLLVVGPAAAVAEFRHARRLAQLPGELPAGGEVRAWAERGLDGAPLFLVQAADAAGLQSALRALPHYGRASLVALEGGRVTLNRVWPPGPSPLQWRQAD
ncbi:MAG: M1 family peptidase [Alphaproteobacteria bacterium]|nr:M1 family peptidase [Alphaproteobacteria bacterium]